MKKLTVMLGWSVKIYVINRILFSRQIRKLCLFSSNPHEFCDELRRVFLGSRDTIDYFIFSLYYYFVKINRKSWCDGTSWEIPAIIHLTQFKISSCFVVHSHGYTVRLQHNRKSQLRCVTLNGFSLSDFSLEIQFNISEFYFNEFFI